MYLHKCSVYMMFRLNSNETFIFLSRCFPNFNFYHPGKHNLISYKGTLILFYESFSEIEEVGRIFWNNGTQSKFKQNELRFDTTNENPDETESGMLHSVISYML